MIETLTNLFVYGTLMPGQANHRQIEEFVRSSKGAAVEGVLVDLGAYPALIPGKGFVRGVVLEVDLAALEITDRIEGCCSDRDRCLYVREEIVVRFEGEQEAVVWTYWYANPDSVADCPRLVVGALRGVPLHAWTRREASAEIRKRETF